MGHFVDNWAFCCFFFYFFLLILNFSGRFDNSGSTVLRLVPEISSLDAFCDGAGAAAGAGIGDSRILMQYDDNGGHDKSLGLRIKSFTIGQIFVQI